MATLEFEASASSAELSEKTPEEKIAGFRNALKQAEQHLDIYMQGLDAQRRGEKLENASPAPLLDAHNILIELSTQIFKLSASDMAKAINDQQQAYYEEWLANGRKFEPKSAMEQDLWDAFHKYQSEGHKTALIFYSDGFHYTHPIRVLDPVEDPWDVIDEMDGLGSSLTIMAVLNLNKTFQEQWPYYSGAIFSPAHLIDNPVIGIPDTRQGKQHPHARYLRSLPKPDSTL